MHSSSEAFSCIRQPDKSPWHDINIKPTDTCVVTVGSAAASALIYLTWLSRNETLLADSEDCRRRQPQVRYPTRTCRLDRRPLPVAFPLLGEHEPRQVWHSLKPQGLKACLPWHTRILSQKTPNPTLLRHSVMSIA